MSRNRFGKTPRALRRAGVHLGTIAIIPASMLPFNDAWQRVTDELPAGAVLMVLNGEAKHQRVVRFVASRLREKGKHVKIVDKDLRQHAL